MFLVEVDAGCFDVVDEGLHILGCGGQAVEFFADGADVVGLAGDADAVAFGVKFELRVDLVGGLPVLQNAFEEVAVG
ncbi:hypothetical protein CGLAU_01765 [Corynebacterium glaucum]|uniref:Uncharacterized protein n=1 Tax=Corynebacterium glaucum TaxID=187491 RepID=A0A1Q2HU60_9CORY|nr:hypothetical protein [Corynebacterium glaucum]AQQ14340.1 hypothetical protein CGLAU_01765 [Corynebacterium glaucum]